MDILARRRLILGLVSILCLIVLGRWALRPDDAVNVSQRSEAPPSVDSPPAQAPPPAIAGTAAAPAPSTVKPASAFGTLRGRVIDAVTREPVREFEVQFHGTRPTKAGEEAPGARTFQSVDGRFEWDYLPPGKWTVTASTAGYERFELVGLQLPKGAATPEIVLPMRRGQALRGRIYDEDSGVGIASARIGFREAGTGRFDGNWRMRSYTAAASDGTFALDNLPPGRITLDVHAQDHTSRELDVTVGDDSKSLEIALATGASITGYLTAPDGITRVKGSAGLFNLDQGFGGTSRTNEAGEFVYRNLAPGRYQLTGQASGGSASREIVLTRNQRLEGIVLALQGGRSIRGVVTGLTPENLKHLTLSLRRDGEAADPYSEVRVDERGAYELRGVQPGRVQVVADVTMRRQLVRTVDVPADSDVIVNLDFPSGARLSGRVTHGGQPLAKIWISPRPAVEQPVYTYGTATADDGTYAIEDLADGEYALLIGDYRSKAVEVSGDTVFDVDVPLAQLSGRILEEGGKVPVVGAVVEIWPTEPASTRNRRQDRSNHFGRFGLAGLEPGEYMLTAYKPGYEMFRKRISYESPVSDMTVRLGQKKGVEIRARGADSGKSLEQLYVTELIGDRDGTRVIVQLDQEGVGYIPSALAGNRLSFAAFGHASVTRQWNGEQLDLRLEPAPQP